MNYKWDLNQYKFEDSFVNFTADDKDLQGVFDDCEALCKQNINYNYREKPHYYYEQNPT